MDNLEGSDEKKEIERSDSPPSEAPQVHPSVGSISADDNPALDSVLPPTRAGDSLENTVEEIQTEGLPPPTKSNSSEVNSVIEKEGSPQEQAPVRISISNDQTNSTNPDSTLDTAQLEKNDKPDGMAAPTPVVSLSPISPTRSSLSSRGARAKQRKRVSFNENSEGKAQLDSLWPRCDEFTVAVGEEAVERFVRESWGLDDSWLHCVDYLGEEPPSSSRHLYRVKFSQPTRRRPIPAHSASVYFTLVSGCEGDLVGVWWALEGQRLVHRPGEGDFREQWLKDVLEAKAIICTETLF